MKHVPPRIAAQLCVAMEMRGLSRRALAKRSGWGYSSIAKWFNGRNPMPLAAAADIAQTLGYDVVLVKQKDRAA